ncbi:MAG: hydrogenase maturation protease [bacterium]|nr:hydrogenase maturation protease [bacterium]
MSGSEGNPAGAGPFTALIIGIGNASRGDDAVGLIAARLIREALLALPDPPDQGRVAVLEQDGEGTALMALWEGAGTVILIDAALSGADPGSIHRFDARSQPLPAGLRRCSTHAFGVAEAIELARALDRLPPRFIVYGIEGRAFSTGGVPSGAVEAAARAVAERVLGDLG